MLHPQAQNLGTECPVIQSQGGPARPRDSSPGRLDRPPSTEPLARRAVRSPSAGPAGCAFSKYKAAGECPNPKAAESAACAPASQAQAALSAGCALRAQSRLRPSQTQSGGITLLQVHEFQAKAAAAATCSPVSQAQAAGATACMSQEQTARLADQQPDCLPGTTPTTPTKHLSTLQGLVAL